MKNSIKKLLAAALSVCLCLSVFPSVAFAEEDTDTTINIALPANNSKVSVTSVTHPYGGEDGTYKKPLSYLNDGKFDPNYLRLAFVVNNETEYSPIATAQENIHVCMDLGAVYDISKLVIKPRNSTGGSDLMEGFTIYGSNDPEVKTRDWKNADKYTIKTIGEDDYTETAGNGYGYKNIKSDYEISISELDEENRSFRYIVLSQPKTTSNKYNYYYINIGDLEVYADPQSAQSEALVNTSIKYPDAKASFDVSVSKLGYTGVDLFEDGSSKVTLIGAQYKNDVLADVQYVDVTKETLAEKKLTFTMPEDTQNVKYRYYIWDSVEGGKPILLDEISTYGLKNVSKGKTVDSVAFNKNENGTWSIDGNSTSSNQFSSFGLCDGSAYSNEGVFYVNNAVDTKNSIDAYVDLDAQYDIVCIKILPRADGQGSTNLANMEIYGFNDKAWIDTLETQEEPRVTDELLSANATLIHKYPADYAEYKHAANVVITDSVTSTIDVGGQSFRYIMCVRPWNGYKYWALGEMEVYTYNTSEHN